MSVAGLGSYLFYQNNSLGNSMIRDIQKCSIQYIQNVLGPLDQYSDYVIWIRNREMNHQIFTSKNFEGIWGRELEILYEAPFLWFDYLNPENKIDYLKQLDQRHNQLYSDPKKNFAYYQVIRPDNNLRYLRCQCFKGSNPSGQQYIIGIAKSMAAEIWYPSYQDYSTEIDDPDKAVQEQLFNLLNQAFGISMLMPIASSHENLIRLRDYLIDTQRIIFSSRELESLYHLCQGRTAKLTAREMDISPRTVETYIENIRIKTACSNKLEVIGRFARYFSEEDKIKS